MPHHIMDIFGWFDAVDTAFQWGVYVDFFEEHDIYPDVIYCHGHAAFKIDSKEKYHAACSDKDAYHALIFTNSKKRARETAIKKAIKIYNSNHAKSNKDT